MLPNIVPDPLQVFGDASLTFVHVPLDGLAHLLSSRHIATRIVEGRRALLVVRIV